MRALHTGLVVLLACGGAPATDSAAPAPPAPPARGRPAPPPAAEEGPKVASVQQGGAEGGLRPEDILPVVKAHRAAISACYKAALPKRPTLAGKVVVSWRIAPDGRTHDIAVRSSTLEDEAVKACILAEVARLVFPAPRSGVRPVVNFPFNFAPPGDP